MPVSFQSVTQAPVTGVGPTGGAPPRAWEGAIACRWRSFLLPAGEEPGRPRGSDRTLRARARSHTMERSPAHYLVIATPPSSDRVPSVERSRPLHGGDASWARVIAHPRRRGRTLGSDDRDHPSDGSRAHLAQDGPLRTRGTLPSTHRSRPLVPRDRSHERGDPSTTCTGRSLSVEGIHPHARWVPITRGTGSDPSLPGSDHTRHR